MNVSQDTDIFADRVIRLKADMLRDGTERLFLRTGCAGGGGACEAGLRKRTDGFFEAFERGTGPKAVIRYYTSSRIRFSGHVLCVDGVGLTCRAFERVDPETVRGVFVYFITAGDPAAADRSQTERMLLDLFGTAVISAARLYILDRLRKGRRLSEEFGPGLYGMDVLAMHKLGQLADASRIGVEINRAGMLVPEKSCGAFCFDVTEDYLPRQTACDSCLGSAENCALCTVGR